LSTEINKPKFEDLYLKVREKEKRLYSDEIISLLPSVQKNHPHVKEWMIRKKSYLKFRNYLQRKNKPLHILDLGCGNGWMSNQLSAINHSVVTGVDLNSYEIATAKRVFKNNKSLTFYAGELFQEIIFQKNQFDIIVLAASIQYFPDLKRLIGQLTEWLRVDGEIHILDSHFYTENNLARAKEASLNYYKGLDCSMMADFYYHHLWSDLHEFHFKIMNRTWKDKILLKIFNRKSNYFPWIIIYK